MKQENESRNTTILFYEFNQVDTKKIKFTATVTRHKKKWVYVQHKERNTWDIPGGHVELGEDITESAERELYEESGAIKYTIEPVCIYSVCMRDQKTYGALFFAQVDSFTSLPDMEMEKIEFFNYQPKNLTYPNILPALHNRVKSFLER